MLPTGTDFAISFGGNLGETFDKDIFFSDPRLKVTIPSNAAGAISILAQGVQPSIIGDAIDALADLAGIGTPGLVGQLQNLDTGDLVDISLDIDGESFSIQINQDLLSFTPTLNVGNFLGTGFNLPGTGLLDSVYDEIEGTINSIGSIDLKNPKIVYKSAGEEGKDQKKSFTYQIQLDNDGNPDNDGTLLIRVSSEDGDSGTRQYSQQLEYRSEGKDTVDSEDGTFNIKDYLPTEIKDLFPAIAFDDPKFILSNVETNFSDGQTSVAVKPGLNVQGVLEADLPLGEEILDFACKFLGIDLGGLLDSNLQAGVSFNVDGSASLNLYLN
ncbi:MAG: hypothetical protein ACO3NK_20615, partial [Prochlorotrichaceae cyanobacterium]